MTRARRAAVIGLLLGAAAALAAGKAGAGTDAIVVPAQTAKSADGGLVASGRITRECPP